MTFEIQQCPYNNTSDRSGKQLKIKVIVVLSYCKLQLQQECCCLLGCCGAKGRREEGGRRGGAWHLVQIHRENSNVVSRTM